MTNTYYHVPLLKAPVWTWEVPVYFFVGGAAGAAAIIANVARWSGANETLVRDARWIAAAGGPVSAGPPAAAIHRASRTSASFPPLHRATLAMMAAAPAAPPMKK